MLSAEILENLPGVRHAFFTRRGGVSEGIFASLNCGLGSGDRAEAVRENRRRAMATFGLEAEHLSTLYQVHSDRVIEIERPLAAGERPKADALVTRRPGLALGVLAADCAPVLLADPEAGVVGAAHAGWKGALAGVVERTVEAMLALGARREGLSAAVGPCIAQDSYEVGPDFPAPFLAQSAANAAFFRRHPETGRPHFDLAGYVLSRLAAAGVGRRAALACDTCAEAERFFSYRRACHAGESDYGRGLSAIALEA